MSLQLYDGLTRFDLSQGSEPPALVGGLAESWSTDDVVNWTFNLREGITFHDGTPWNADAAVFNLDRFTNPESEFFTPDLAGLAGLFTQSIASYEAVDEFELAITTNRPWSHLPEDLTLLPMASPTAVRELGTEGFAAAPVGSGPFMFESLEPGERLVMAANPDYWAGAPQVARLILRPIPDATARVAALRAGEVNWIEYASPDDVAGLRDEGFQTIANAYSHIWRGVFDQTKTPWDDPRVPRSSQPRHRPTGHRRVPVERHGGAGLPRRRPAQIPGTTRASRAISKTSTGPESFWPKPVIPTASRLRRPCPPGLREHAAGANRRAGEGRPGPDRHRPRDRDR